MRLNEIEQAVHICPGVMDIGLPRGVSPNRVILLRDSLAQGPVRVDPHEHAQIRRNYWKSHHGFQRPGKPQKWSDAVSVSNFHEFAERITSQPTPEVVIWRVPEQPLCDLWAMDCLERMDFSRRKVFLCVSRQPAWRIAGANNRGLENHRLSKAQLRTGAALWKKYATAGPTVVLNAFDKANERLCGIGASIEPLMLAMPRRGDARGQFRLSRLDERILNQLKQSKWQCAANLREIRCKSGYAFNHTAIAQRLRAWAEHASANRLVEYENASRAVNHLTDRVYRLTRFGGICIKRGMDRLDIAPPMQVASWNLYADPIFSPLAGS